MKGHEYKYSFKNQFRTMASMSVYRTGHQQCSGGYHRGLEVRDFYLIHFVMEGGGVYTLNGRKHPVRKGQAFLIYPSHAHRLPGRCRRSLGILLGGF